MLIEQVRENREKLSKFRIKRNRCRDYTFGRQWNDLIEVDGRKITEYEYILREGNVPLKNNLIRRIVRNVLGVFHGQIEEIMETFYGGQLKDIANRNRLDELFCRTMEEFLISGMAIHRKWLGFRDGKAGIRTDIVSPDTIFFNTDSRDVRGWDLNMIGQTHLVDFRQWCNAFVKTKEDYRHAEGLFDSGRRKINVTEVWRKETRPRFLVHDRKTGYIRRMDEREAFSAKWKHMPRKWILDEVWHYYFLTDDGTKLTEGDSPYAHGSHPFVIKCYPFLDGEIQSFVADMIDQQRYTNRLITLMYGVWVIR